MLNTIIKKEISLVPLVEKILFEGSSRTESIDR